MERLFYRFEQYLKTSYNGSGFLTLNIQRFFYRFEQYLKTRYNGGFLNFNHGTTLLEAVIKLKDLS